MKKFLSSKGFKVAALSVCCVGILAACFFFSRESGSEFSPEPLPPAGTADGWEEPAGSPEVKKEENSAAAYGPVREAATKEPYPKVVEESEGETVIDFTPPAEESKPEAPEKPVTQADNTNPAATPSYEPEDLEVEDAVGKDSTSPAGQEGSTGDTPSPGDRNEKGEYYVPGFGWSLPSPVEQTVMDNDGDPNKQVGNM